MATFSLFALASILFFNLVAINAQRPTTSTTSPNQQSTTPIPETFDASIGGKAGAPGAQIRFSTKALDEVYKHAVTMIAEALRAMEIPDVIVPIGGGMLTIKSIRITEAKIPKYERELAPPNRIRSQLSNGRFVAIGEWQYKPFGSGARSIAQGVFRTVVVDAELNIINQLSRTWDAKPKVDTTECKANLSQFRIEIEGFGDNTTVIEQCTNVLCQRIRSYFEEAVCNTARQYVKETINNKLTTFPTRVTLGLGPTGKSFVMNYDLLNGEPKVNEQFIQSYLEGEVLSRGVSSAPFGANELSSTSNDSKRMISFPLGDYAFNTLFHHAHAQQFRFSAADNLNSSNAIKDLLKLNCSSSTGTRRYKGGVQISSGFGVTTSRGLCLGAVFDNTTNLQFPVGALGDLVFKTQRPLAVIVRQPQKSFFGAASGVIEAYGPADEDGKRELLGRADVELLRGDFYPAMEGCNITGQVNITDLQLAEASPPPVQARIRRVEERSLIKLAQLAKPILKEMFNSFLDQYAQFPVPLIDGYECASPEFSWSQRTMQIDCDVRVHGAKQEEKSNARKTKKN